MNTDRYNQIEIENRILLQKMTKIMENSTYSQFFGKIF